MIELAHEQGVSLPADDPESLAEIVHVRAARNLEEYLERFYITVSIMQTPAALERIAYEFVQDLAAENVRYAEVRYCPALHTPAMSLGEAVEAPLAGLKRGEQETGMIARLIVAGLRTLEPTVSEDLARLALDYAGDGVVAFDLAGSEHGHPARDHARAFDIAHSGGLPCTCHAGEGDGPDSIDQALHTCGAHRVGHGTRLREDRALEEYVIENRIPLEVCLTSNVHTRTVDSIAEHPVRRYLEMGGMVTLNTDSRLVDGTTLSDEYWLAHTELGFGRTEIDRVITNTLESGFLPEVEKAELVRQVRRELAEIE
jgi:adenosine deaminase